MPKNLRVFPSLILVLLFLNANTSAQDLHPGHIQEKILENNSYSYTFNAPDQIEVVSMENALMSNYSIEEIGVNAGYIFTYTPDTDFNGKASFIVAWPTVFNHEVIAYTRIDISVVPTLLAAEQDFVVMQATDASVLIDVTANDGPENYTVSLIGTELVTAGSAIIENGQVRFTPSSGFTGTTSFLYTIEDQNGHAKKGIVTVQVFDESLDGSSLSYSVQSGEEVHILLDDPNYVPSEAVDGLSQVSPNVWAYQSQLNYSGIIPVTFNTPEGSSVSASITVIDEDGTDDYVNDDEYFTSVDNPITFDPLSNDYGQEGVMIDYSPELVWDGEQFTYTPGVGYSGYQEFFYTVFNGLQEVDGKIEIYVGNYLPQKSIYNLVTKEGTPAVIDYDAPISNYTWNQVDAPDNGSLTLGVRSYLPVNCYPISSRNILAIYKPNAGFIGQDQFIIEYCVDNGACKEVLVNVDVQLASDPCHCYGDDCVWAGDVDNNGKVSVQDLLGIGYNYGEGGTTRSNSGTDWCANYADDWDFDQVGGQTNNKYADANGDGIINFEDTIGIAANIDAYHDIASKEVLAEKDDVLSFTTSATSISQGEIIDIQVTLGSETQPVSDRQGIAFGIQFPEGINQDNIRFIPDASWFGQNSPLLTMSFSRDGYLQVGMVRTSDKGIYGLGDLGTLQIEGNEDIDGWRPEDNEVELEISIDDAVVTDGSGTRYSVQAEQLELLFKLNRDGEEIAEPKVNVFPNPSVNTIGFSAQSGDIIRDIQVNTITGAFILSKSNIGTQNYTLEHTLPEGMYITTIRTDRGVVNESVVVSRGR